MQLKLSFIKNIPITIEGKFRGASIVLLSGNLGTNYDWDAIQKDLSRYTKVFSFTRPDAILYNRYYQTNKIDERFPLYFPDNRWLSFHGQSELLFALLQYYKVESPYIIVGFSKGGLYALAFAHYYEKYVKYVILIDSQIHDINTPEFKEERAIVKNYKDKDDKTTKEMLARLKEVENEETEIYKRTGLFKPANEKSRILNYFVQKHYYYNIKYLPQVPWQIAMPIIMFQNIFASGNIRTDINWSAKYQHKLRKYNDIMIYTFLDDIHALYITQRQFIVSIIKGLRKNKK